MYTCAHFDSYLMISPHFLQMGFGGEESKSPFIGIPHHIPKIFWATSHATESRQILRKMPWSMDMTQLFHIISRLSSKKTWKFNEDQWRSSLRKNWNTRWWYTYPSEKWWSSSVGMMKFPTEWKVIIHSCSKPGTRYVITTLLKNISVNGKDDIPYIMELWKINKKCSKLFQTIYQSEYGFVWKCWVNIPNEIAI